ncbi:uncharacterized protein I206_101649 [Kwoniella pini CBS 10737]|uniref:DH domain-containing protein n=1 Tax=Kwoniella pini CBS 10737 TaxID=1296096 RepID=A0A1B9HW36_9TREE|nr:uncharacterized protein I206_06381 [Kwoniella pini CBS 10737]OCF47480.1 hypothetical protein I206_06381 [Kwoniella pini CBS 10737]
MPATFSSPPLRQSRSPGGDRSASNPPNHSADTPPLPQLNPPTSPYTTMTRSSRYIPSPRRAAPAPPPVPALPSPSLKTGSYGTSFPTASPSPHLTASPIVRSTSSSSSYSTTSSSSSTSQRVSTPPPPIRNRRTSKSSSKLLPALPLSIATPGEQPSPYDSPASGRSKRAAVDFSEGIGLGLGLTEEVQIIVSREGRRSRAVSVSYGSSNLGISSPNVSAEDLACLPTPPMASQHQSPSPALTYVSERTPSRSSIKHTITIPISCDTPPRPARRSASVYPSPASATTNSRRSPIFAPRPISLTPQSHSDLLPPQTNFARSVSPSGDSISTVTLSPASTPRPFLSEIPKPSITVPPDSSAALSLALEENITSSAPMGGRKRDSAQRRLSALRGLVASLDFNQPWSSTGSPLLEENIFSPSLSTGEQEDNDSKSFVWACSDEQNENGLEPQSDCSGESFIMSSSSEEVLASPTNSISNPIKFIQEGSTPKSILQPEIAESHGWPEPKTQPQQIYTSPSTTTLNSPRVEYTPVRRNSGSRKIPSSTPPRRPKQFRTSSELLSRTPEPPRPTTRTRKEVFEVASSGYSKSLEPSSPTLPTTPTSTWRSSLANDELYNSLMQNYGPLEVKRQEIIWEMCETEHTFIKSTRTVLRLFATPLKTPQGKWIDGIPGKITDLFDSLECIAHSHGVISAIERDMRRKSDILDVGQFVSTFKNWVGRLEVHEWYLIRFESVVALVEENVRDPDSVFGEFVRMQMKDEVLGSMSLGSMLLKPVQRLTKYPLFLKRLLDATPHPHPVHPEILSLLSTTESIILNLQATKAREEDFEQLQMLETRLVGLPENFTLAIRGRKLLGQAQVVRIPPSKDLVGAFGNGRSRAGSMHSSRGSISSSVSSSAPSTASSVSPWDFSASLAPSSRTSAFSVSSNGSSFCSSIGGPSRSNSINNGPSQYSSTSPGRPSINRSPSSTCSFLENNSYYTSSRPSTPSSGKSRKKEEVFTMLIFDDLVILGQAIHEKAGLFGVGSKKKGNGSIRVLSENEGGIGKVEEIRDWSGWGGYANLFSLTTIPSSTSNRYQSPPITTAFALPANASSGTLNSISTSPSLRSLKSSSSLSSNVVSKEQGIMSNLTCPILSNMSAILGMLGQVSTSGRRHSEYVIEEKEILEDHEGEENEVENNEEAHDHEEWGYAA